MKRLRAPIIVGTLALIIAWSWRPLPPVGASEPYFAGSLPDKARAIAVADSLFQLTGIAIDSMWLDAPGTLVIVVAPGALVSPVRMVDGSCQGGEHSWFAMRTLGVQFDALYSAPRRIQRLDVRTQPLLARASGWGWRRECGVGGASTTLLRRELDSLQRTAG